MRLTTTKLKSFGYPFHCPPQIFDLGSTDPAAWQSCELWHQHSVIVFVQIILQLLTDLIALFKLSVRARRSVEAENLFLRRELPTSFRSRCSRFRIAQGHHFQPIAFVGAALVIGALFVNNVVVRQA